MIGDLVNEAYLLRGVDAHAHLDANMRVRETNGDPFDDPARLAHFTTALPLLATTMRPTLGEVRVVLLRFERRTFATVMMHHGYLVLAARPETPLRNLRSTAMKVARTLEHEPQQAPAHSVDPRPAVASRPSDSVRARTKLGIWD